jgi:hypothetical protein
MIRANGNGESLPNRLRRLIAESGESHYALGKRAGVDPRAIDRFFARQLDLKLETAGKLAAALGAELVHRRGRGSRPPGSEV